jgi:selenocysteine lyase/cysteine desulfurase
MDWKEARALFPAVGKTVYLNTAGGAPLSRGSAAAGLRYYQQSLDDGDVHWDDWLEQVEAVRRKLARFLVARPLNLAFTANASTGLNIAAHMLRGAGRVLTVADEFPSVTLPFLQLGYDVDFVPTDHDGTIGIDDLESADSPDTGVLAISFVQYRSGFRADLAVLGEYCRERDMALVVDATQGFGAFPIDVSASHVDFLSFSGYKWATCGYSIGALYVGGRFLEPAKFPLVGWRSAREPYALRNDELDLAESAVALEQGHPPFAGIFALGASLDQIEKIGIGKIAGRILELTRYLHERLDGAGIWILSTRDEAHLSGITLVAVDEPAAVVAALKERGIIVSARGNGIRVSVHYYNDHADVDRFVEALAELTAG